VLYSYNKAKEDVNKENTFIVLYCKKLTYKWTSTVQTMLFKAQLYFIIVLNKDYTVKGVPALLKSAESGTLVINSIG